MAETLTDYVHDSLRARLRNGQAGAAPLTLAALAAEYGVSLMPVRLAVRRLIDEGWLQRCGGRLVFTDRPGGRACPRTRVSPPTPPRNREQEIQRDVIRLSFGTPPGALREDHWAATYATTRTVIRQIFARLAGQGLLEHRPRHGWYLRAFSVKDLRDFLHAREALELKALELARGRLETPVLRDLLAGNVLPRGSAHPRTDNRLHAYIIARADNRYISSFFERHGPYYDLLFEWEALDRASELQACYQHRRILRALMADDWSAAGRALSDHILHNHDLLDAAQFDRWSHKASARLASRRSGPALGDPRE